MARTSFKKQKNDLLGEILLIEEDALWDEDVQELRHQKWVKDVEREEKVRLDAWMKTRERYFCWNGECWAHSQLYCSQCNCWASGKAHPLEYL